MAPADAEQWSSQQGSSETETHNRAETTGETDTTGGGKSSTRQTSEGQSADLREQFHVRPLLLADEARRYLRPMEDNPNDPIAVQEAIREHPAYPGLALIRLATEPDPFFVRKANYDQDPFFVRKFSPNPAFRFVPLEEQPLFGWQITPDFFYELRLDVDLREPGDDEAIPRRSILADRDRCPVILDLAQDWKAGDRIEAGQQVIAVKPDDPAAWLTVLPPERVETPRSFKVFANGWRRGQPDGNSVMLLRNDAPLSGKERRELAEAFWGAVDCWARKEVAERKRSKLDEIRSLKAKADELSSRLLLVQRKIEQGEATINTWEKHGPELSRARNELHHTEYEARRAIANCKDGPILDWLGKNEWLFPFAMIGVIGGLATIFSLMMLLANVFVTLPWVQTERIAYSLPITGLILFAYFALLILDTKLMERTYKMRLDKARAKFARIETMQGKNIESDYLNAQTAMNGLQLETRRLLADLKNTNQLLAEKRAELSEIVG